MKYLILPLICVGFLFPSKLTSSLVSAFSGFNKLERKDLTDVNGTESNAPLFQTPPEPSTWIWPANITPIPANGEDGVPLNLGVRFRSSANGFIHSIRFWKRTGNNGTHTGTLWTNTGTKLAEVTFTNETASGWQTASFATPVPITANTTYIASYFCPLGQYSKEPNYFNPTGGTGTYSANPPLSAPADGLFGGNGLYAYSSGVAFPSQSAASSNYWVDVQFNAANGTATNQPPVINAAAGPVITLPANTASLTATATDSDGTIASFAWSKLSGPAGGTIATPTATNTNITGLNQGIYVYRLTVTDNLGAVTTADVTVTVNAAATTQSTWIWPAALTPAGSNGEDGVPLNLGVRFRSATNGFINSIRFWKRTGNNGTHTGTLWTNTGTKLAEVTFTNETASGWQTASFATPVPITANTTYIASYFCPLGQYSKEPNYFNPIGGTGTYSANPPLSAPADGLFGGNGLYAYSSSVAFPAQSAASSNYWIDVQFNTSNGTVANQAPVINAAAGPVITLPANTASLTATATDADGTIASYAWSKLSGPAGGTIASPTSANTNITGLNQSIYIYRLTVTDNLGAVTTADLTVTVNAAATAQSTWIWPATLNPAGSNGEDGVPLNLGVRFRSSANGFIHSIRFWKRTGNNGTHTGTLWTNTGTKLAEVTFTNETASGWQTASFATPVPITANTTYIASYFCPLGQYSKEPNYFNPTGGTGTYSANPPLSAPTDGLFGGNGLYTYGSGVTFPGQSAASSNYWVDVQFNAAGGTYTGNLPPITDAGLDQTITLPATSLILNGIATDPDGSISTYSWIKVSGPAGDIISTPNQVSTRVSNLIEGTYVFSLIAADNRTAADTDQVTVRVLPAVLSPVNFSAIPFSDPDIIAPFRGAEDWHFSNATQRISHPTESQHAVPQDVYYRSFLSWDKLESSPGNYDWAYLNQLFNDAISKRQKISFGIMSQVPGQQNATIVSGANIAYPVYLHNLMQADAADKRDYISPYENMWVPNYNSEYYLSRFEALLNALATHINNSSYNGIPYKDALGYVDIRGYGSWGEWNMVGVANRAEDFPVGRRPLAGSLIRIVDAHKNAFPNSPLISLLAAYDGSRFSNILIPPAVGYHILTTSNAWGKIGWRMDSYGWSDAFVRALAEENTTVYNGMRFDTAIMNRYRYAPIAGEGGCGLTVNGGPHPFWYVPRQVRTYHTSLLGNGNFCGENLTSLAGRDSMRLAWKISGYRIIIESGTISSIIQKGSALSISLNWKNTGLAPVYENWNVYYELQNQSTNEVVWSGLSAHKLKLWQPAATATTVADSYMLPATIPNGTYRLVLKIKDPLNYRAPLPLAIANRRADGSYSLRENITLSAAETTSMIAQNQLTDEKTNLVKEVDEKVNWSVYPVPVKRGTPLFIAGHSGKTYTIRLLDSGGGLVLKKTANGPVQLETSNFRTGLYFMQLTDQTGKTVKRIIIMD